MTTFKYLLSIALLSFFLVSCDFAGLDELPDEFTVEPIVCETAIIGTEDGSGTTSMAKLSRFRKWVAASFTVENLKPNNSYYVWWVIYNNPELCQNPFECGSPDMEQADEVGIELILKDSIITDENGSASYEGALVSFDNSDSYNEKMGMSSNNGLTKPSTAEIHILLKENDFNAEAAVSGHGSECAQNCDAYFLPVPRAQYQESGCSDVMYSTFPTNCDD